MLIANHLIATGVSGGVAVLVQTHVMDLLKREFPHLTDNQVKVTVLGMFSLNQDVTRFRDHLSDFLVQIKVSLFIYSNSENVYKFRNQFCFLF